mgnify:CR=1 FL=1
MLLTPQIREEVQVMLMEEWQAMPAERLIMRAGSRHAGMMATHCPVIWVLDDLLDLLAENHDRPVEELRPAITRLILERAYMDNVMALGSAPPLEKQVELTVVVLERVRQMAMERGQWSDQQAAPQMCG